MSIIIKLFKDTKLRKPQYYYQFYWLYAVKKRLEYLYPKTN